MDGYWDWKTFWKIIGIVFVVVLALSILAFVMGWISLPFIKGGAGNVEHQFDTGYSLYTSLQSTARSVCTAQKAYDNETNPDLKAQRQTQLTAYETNYNRLEAQYDAWASNIFQGQVIRPADLPVRAPTLDGMKQQVCTQ